MVYSLECINSGGVIRLKIEHLKSTTNPLKISLEWPLTGLVGQYKVLRKEAMGNFTYKNGTLIQKKKDVEGTTIKYL